ncbi:MAG: sodium/solute symporter [Phycisphaera sp.]|nr:sodium/solute symporter [Phycisphaera sp.]
MAPPPRSVARLLTTAIVMLAVSPAFTATPNTATAPNGKLIWQALPDLPDPIGVAGPFVGVHNDALIVAGGANFPVAPGEDLWTATKVWHDDAWVLTRDADDTYTWHSGFKLDKPVAYGACVSTPRGVVCIGGNTGDTTYADVFLLTWDPATKQIAQTPLPPLPQPCANMAATLIGSTVYVAGGHTGPTLASAAHLFYRLDLSTLDDPAGSRQWDALPPWPGPERAFNLVVAQHNGFDDCVYVIGGRRQTPGVEGDAGIIAMADVYEFDPKRYDASAFDAATGAYAGVGTFAEPWRRRADAPKPTMAGTGAAIGQSHIFVLSGADGEIIKRMLADPDLVQHHPGFPKRAWAYHTITDTWIDAGPIPSNQVTTPVTRWADALIVAAGEVRPRVRTAQVWRITPRVVDRSFGTLNFAVLGVYLLATVGVGVYFMRKNRSTDDFFRGGKQVAWWAAGCSIYATMLSSITYMAIPAKAFAQDWVYLMGNMMIIAVAPIAVYLALPFFRRIDATSAYEYLEQRFNRPVRLFASAMFTLFHVFRMAIVMSLAGLALATVTPMTAWQCVLIMGVLSMLYSTLGGVEAVIWTDTIQTFVLLGGALLCFALMVLGTDGGFGSFVDTALREGKLHTFNLHLDPSSANLALWVVIVGALGQNISSYTSDQAVVQRYMTTPTEKRAAASIWMAAILTVPSTLLFFALGTGLFTFYHSHPDKLDPTFMTDQIFPLFIADEVPVGVAGLIVAGIFAAAQSTISTSMNSTATALVTDFLRPFNVCRSERSYLNVARTATLAFGVVGTLLGLLFVSPHIKSLFDQFLKIIGLFMGVLGGLFALGILTRRCNGPGALVGVVCGAAVMFGLPFVSKINGFLYATIGIATCFVIGYVVSFALPARRHDLTGLTVHTLAPADTGDVNRGQREPESVGGN